VEPHNLSETGSIIDIKKRLVLWARRSPKGLARVEFASEFSRQRVVQQVRAALAEQNIPFYKITLPSQQDPEILVAALLQELERVKSGVVSITGFSTAFTNKVPLEESMRILNFNRERLVANALNQIWWMTPSFLQTSIHAMPDINSWFSLRLQLTEMVLMEPASVEQSPINTHGAYANIDDARRRVHNLLQRFQQAQSAGTPDLELIQTYLLPALEALADVGAQKDLRDLTLQFEGLLGQLKLTNSPELADSLNRLAKLYYDQGRYSEAEPLYLRSLNIYEHQLGSDHLDIAQSLNNLAALYQSQGRYSEAEPLYLRSLNIYEHQLGFNHPDIAQSLNNLAGLYHSQGRYSEAEPLYVRAIKIYEQQLGSDHPDVATSLNNLAGLYHSQGQYSEAELLYARSLNIRERQLGPDHPDVANSLNNLATLYANTKRCTEAEPLLVRALALRQQLLGDEHPHTLGTRQSLKNLQQGLKSQKGVSQKRSRQSNASKGFG
jgi:tetratricopeptide (TPR) repeat protein